MVVCKQGCILPNSSWSHSYSMNDNRKVLRDRYPAAYGGDLCVPRIVGAGSEGQSVNNVPIAG